MATFGLAYFLPVTARFPYTHQLFPTPSSNSCFISLTSKRCSSNHQLLLVHVKAQAQSQPTTSQFETPEQNVVEVEDKVSKTRLVVQNVPWTCGADDIRPLFENYGAVVDIELSMYNKARNRGLAFVTMGSNDEAAAALTNLESKEFEGRVLKLNWANPKKKKPSSVPQPKPLPVHNLFVANLPFQAKSKDLKEFFNAEGGNAVSAEVIFHDKPRRSAGYGFVSFNTETEARASLATFEGKEFMGRPIRVAQSKKFLRQETKATIESENANVN